MSSSQQISIVCHECEHEWQRRGNTPGSLRCPECASEFVEIVSIRPRHEAEAASSRQVTRRPTLEPGETSPLNQYASGANQALSPYRPPSRQHQEAPDPGEMDISAFNIANRAQGRTGTLMSFTIGGGTFGGSTNFTAMPSGRQDHQPFASFGQSGQRVAADSYEHGYEQEAEFRHNQGGIFGFHPPRPNWEPQEQPQRSANQQPNPQPFADPFQNLFMHIMGGNARTAPQTDPNNSVNGLLQIMSQLLAGSDNLRDMAVNDEDLDDIITHLMEAESHGPPPASSEDIESLPKKALDETMLNEDGKAQCTICMDDVAVGEEVKYLYCNHWFHEICIGHWLQAHDTCPHCRMSLKESREKYLASKTTAAGPGTPNVIPPTPDLDQGRSQPRRHSTPTRPSSSRRQSHSHSRNRPAPEGNNRFSAANFRNLLGLNNNSTGSREQRN
ncbi:hypothetical protein EJ08DRAFT_335906 [Tothia fuscella]|uniref:RING-type E3 ubiquitin transferase n=1 Tax=Tothia fuscella TaxID=1048955 RepID=A0A9P4U250_9PEZI|nr:hypothetical protein EJ08DRAFT_335906 [Tothia fuscella]